MQPLVEFFFDICDFVFVSHVMCLSVVVCGRYDRGAAVPCNSPTGASRPEAQVPNCSEISWQKCVLYQDDSPDEKLQCPSNNPNKCAVESGYVNFCTKSVSCKGFMNRVLWALGLFGPCLVKTFHPQLFWNKTLLSGIGHVTSSD